VKLVARRISQLGRVVTGKTPPTSRYEFFDGEYPFVTPTDLEYDHYYCRSTERTVTDSAKATFRNQFIPAEAVMFTCIGATIGKCALAPVECLTNQQINSVIADADTDPKFVYYLLCYNADVVKGLGGGAATPIVSKSKFEQIELLVPPFREQQQTISSILSAYDDQMENNRRRIELLENAARLLYQEWFVRLHYPGHEHTPIIHGVPQGWERKRVDQLCEIQGGKQINNEKIQQDGKYPVFGGNGIQGYTEGFTHERFVIAFGRVGANCGSVHWSYRGAWINNNASGLVPHSHPEVLLHHLLNFNFSNLRKGAAQPFIPNGVLSTVEFLEPLQELKGAFCDIIRPIRLQQATLEQQNQKLRAAQRLLLPRLMSGEITV